MKDGILLLNADEPLLFNQYEQLENKPKLMSIYNRAGDFRAVNIRQKMDGIVYAVCVSLGFAALENIMYLFTNAETYLSVGIARAIFPVPGHFCFGILMGYYYSLAKFYPQVSKKNKALILVAPIIVHGLYDSILFIINVTPAISGILLIVFLVFCHKMWKYGSRRIKEVLAR